MKTRNEKKLFQKKELSRVISDKSATPSLVRIFRFDGKQILLSFNEKIPNFLFSILQIFLTLTKWPTNCFLSRFVG